MGNAFVDVVKPRTTKTIETRAIPFVAGNRLRLNNVLSGAQIKMNTTDTVELRDARLETTKSNSVGNVIGQARVYDYKLQNSGYSNNSSVYELFLYDIVTDTSITINQAITQNAPALIEGSRSGARGMLKTDASNTATLTLSETSGKFVNGEQIIINGVTQGLIITATTEYDISDVKSIRGSGGGRTFKRFLIMCHSKPQKLTQNVIV